MNTVQVQLNDKQYDAMMRLLDIAMNELESDIKHGEDTDAEELLTQHDELTKALVSTKSYLWSSGCGRVDLDIEAHHVDAIAQSGDNEPACLAAIEEDGYLRHQLEGMDMEAAINFLTDAGIENAEKKSNDDIRVILLWIACHDINEERNTED